MIMVITRDPVYSKCMNALQQVQLAQDMFVLFYTTWGQMLPKVTARGGRPVLICEEGDAETQRLNPDNCLTIPHTVDCLQVGNLSCFSAGTLWLWTVVTIIVNPTWCRGQMLLLLCCREFSALFHYSYSPTTWPSSSEYSHTLLMRAVSFTQYIFLCRGCNVDCPRNLAKSVTVEWIKNYKSISNLFLWLSELSSPFCTKTQMKRTLKRRILEIPTRCTLRGRCCVDARLSRQNKFARWNSGNSWKPTLKDSINTWHTMVMWWWSRLTRQNCGTTCVLKWAQEIGNIAGLCLNFTDGQFLDQKFAFRFLPRTCSTFNFY